MEYQRPIADWEIGNEIEGFYVLKSAQQRTSNSGKPFLNATLADRTGAVEAKMWDYSGPVGQADEGTVVKVRGAVTEFRGAAQFIIARIRTVQEGEKFDLADLVPAAPIDPADA